MGLPLCYTMCEIQKFMKRCQAAIDDGEGCALHKRPLEEVGEG